MSTTQLIELWETFLMQLDAEEDGQLYYKPPVADTAAPMGDSGSKPLEGETQAGNAATITLEQEA